jgi:hypothetical protein
MRGLRVHPAGGAYLSFLSDYAAEEARLATAEKLYVRLCTHELCTTFLEDNMLLRSQDFQYDQESVALKCYRDLLVASVSSVYEGFRQQAVLGAATPAGIFL